MAGLDCRGVPADELCGERAAELARFRSPYRERIAELICCSPEAIDLIDTFPALLFALVSGRGHKSARAKAFATVLNGGSAKTAARHLGLPLWLRKLPPEAFAGPISHLPDEPGFNAMIANWLPKSRRQSSDWLVQIGWAVEACSPAYALWSARHYGATAAFRRRALFRRMAAWAWFSSRPETAAHRLMVRSWTPKMGMRRAIVEMERWENRMELACVLGDGIEAPWLEEGRVDNFDFVALRTVEDFIAESDFMSNCLDQYAARLATGLVRVFAVRSAGVSLANVEIGPISSEEQRPAVIQIKAARNRPASARIERAVAAWLGGQRHDLPPRPGPVRAGSFEDAQQLLYQPYLDWLPERIRSDFVAAVLSSDTHRAPVRGTRTLNARL